MTVKVSEYVEAERRFYGNRWDNKITIIMRPPGNINPEELVAVDLPAEQAEQLGKDILELIKIARAEERPIE